MEPVTIVLFAFIIILFLGIICSYFRCQRKNKEVKEKEKFLLEEKKVLEAIFKNVHAYILLINKKFEVLQTNYYSLTGSLKKEEPMLIGNLLRCKNGEDAGECGKHELCRKCPIRAAITKSFETKQEFSELEIPMIIYVSDRAGDCVECEVTISGVYLNMSGQERMLLTVHDVTKMKKIQEELAEKKLRAEKSDRLKSTFLANMSHEIRTPLNAIMGFSELLATSETLEDKKKYLEIIEANNNLLLQLINDILDLSKIEAGTLEFIYSNVDVNQMCSDLEGVFRMKVGNNRVFINFIGTDEACYIHTERNRVSQVISNFITNAVKFTPEGGSITFGYEVREEDIYFYVTDTGTGIPKEEQEKIFQRFVKLNAKKQGTGLGLSISSMIIERLGGQIGVKSEVGKGSTFWFTLPVKPLQNTFIQETCKESAGNMDSVRENKEKTVKTLLIAEDMEDNYLLYQAFLSKEYNLLRAHDGEEAISLFLQNEPDAILMDLRMPVVDGYQATEAIRELSTTIPIVAVTAFAFPEDKKKVLSRGFTDYLAKPIKKDSLFEKLRSIGL